MKNNNSKVKVLIVGSFPKKNKNIYGGQFSSCNTLINSTFSKKFNVSTLDSTITYNFLKIIPIRLLFGLKRIAYFFLIMLFNRPDVAIIFFANGFSAIEKGIMARISILFQIPVMVFPRAGGLIVDYKKKFWFSILIRYTLGKSNLFLCQGKAFQFFAIRYLGFSKLLAPIIPNWTASKKHLNIGKSKNYKKKISVINILFLGWLENFKGVHELLEAARILKKKIPFHLTLAGNGSAISEAKKFVTEHQLKNNITFAGWVDEKKKALLLKNSQIFVLPSWSEGFPNAMIEAMSAGLACVVTNVGTISDFVVHNRDALVIKKKNIKQLVRALQKLISDHTLRISISKNGHLLAKKTFNIDNSLCLFSKIINKIVKT